MKEVLLTGTMLAVMAASAVPSTQGSSKMPIAASAPELINLLRQAKSGSEILLAPGEYQNLVIQGVQARSIVVRSADPRKPAVIGPFIMAKSSGVTFRDLEFSNAGSSDAWAWRILDSHDIHFDRLDVHGSLDGNPQNDRQGIQIRRSSQISITNSVFHELYRSISPSDTSDIRITNNRFHDNARTGIFSSNVENVTISGNSFTDSYPIEGDHMDAIAFTKIGPTNTTRNVLVSHNVITRGKGRVTQGIFFRDPSKGETHFSDIRIKNNLIIGMGLNGIYVNSAERVTIEGNTVLAYPGKSNNSWILLQYVNHGEVRDNRASLISITPPANQNRNVSQAGNLIVPPVTDNGAAALADHSAKQSN